MKTRLITHLVWLYPNYEKSLEIINILNWYSDFIELQFPFSDTVADWETISQANYLSIKNWSKTEKCFDFILEVPNIAPKIIIMTYFNIVYNYWIENFIKKSRSLWVYWIIIPDLPFDEKYWDEIINLTKKYNINLIYVVSPNTSEKRLKEISKFSSGFIYAISKTMTTWNEIIFDKDFNYYIKKLNSIFKIPIWIWFGIKNRNHIKEVLKYGNFAIIWSELLKIYNKWWILELKNYFNNLDI